MGSSKVAPEPARSSQDAPAPPSSGGAQAPTPALPAAAHERSEEDKKAYGDHHRPRLEAEIKAALIQAIDEGAADPVARVGELLLAASGGPQPKLELPPADEEASDKWSLTAWLRGAGVHRVAAAVLQRGMAGRDALTVLKGLDNRGAFAALLSAGALAEGLADLLWPEVETLKRAGAATGEEIQSKFAGSIEMSYAGLDTFFGGLEGVVGAPDPQSYEKMEEEHTKMPDSNQEFTTGNYGVKTSSALEWDFVVDEEAARV